MEPLKCGQCGAAAVRLYRPYGNFYRPEDNRCNACLDKAERGYYVPVCTDEEGSIWGYSSVPQKDVDKFLALPEKVANAPTWIGNKGWSDDELLFPLSQKECSKIEIRYGDRVTFTSEYVRRIERRIPESGVYTVTITWKVWKARPTKGTGIFLGTRTLANGIREWEGDEVGYIFAPKEYIKAALISPGPNRNTIYVPLECVTQEP